MSKFRIPSLTAVIFLILSCGAPQAEKHIPELLDFVPSDALVIASYDKACDAVALLDTSNVLRKFDYGQLKNSKAVLSVCYTSSLIPVLAIDTGKATPDTLKSVAGILTRAEEAGIKAEYIHDSGSGKHGALVITPSITELNSARRHFDENVSVTEADGFMAALDKCATSKEWIILRNRGADKFIPRNFLMNYLSRRDLSSFMQKTADWTTLVPHGQNGFTVDQVYGDFDTYYTKMLASLPATQSKLGSMLPRSTEFAIALPVPEDQFRKAMEGYLDATVRLERYRKRLKDLESESGKNPKTWEKENDIREVAVVKWNNRAVSLVRPAKAAKDMAIEQNPYKGFIPALYGQSFAINDESCYACSGGWIIFGGEEDLEAFINCEHGLEGSGWPGKHARAIVLSPSFLLCWNSDGIQLNNKKNTK